LDREKPAPSPRLVNVSRSAAILLACLAMLVLAGWQFGIEPLKRISPAWVAMNPTTAIWFLLASIALILTCRTRRVPSRSPSVIRILGLTIAAFGLINLIRCLGGPDLHIDQMFYNLDAGAARNADHALRSSRVAPNTALLFLAFGVAVLMMQLNHVIWRIAAGAITVFGLVIALVGALGYWNEVAALYRPTSLTPMAMHTAIGFILFAVALLTCGSRTVRNRRGAVPDEDLFTVHQKMALGFVAALFAMAVIGIVCLASLHSLVTSNEATGHSHQVLESTLRLSVRLSDAETGERGYLLTGNEAFLEPYHNAVRQLQTNLDELGELVADDPYQRPRFDELVPLVRAELGFLQQVIDGERAGTVEAGPLIIAGVGKQRMDAARQVLAAMRQHETAEQEIRARHINRIGHVTVMVVAASSVFAFILVGVAGWLIRQDLITKQHVATALRHARSRADEANDAKSRFLANMSHEIRTPITAIIGYANLVLDASQSASDRINHVHTIRRNSEHLLTLINDILDLSKIESGKFTVERIPCSPCQVLYDVTSLMRIRAIEKKIRFKVTNDGPVPTTVLTDPVRLRQILINLVGNAIKFTDEGYVKLIMRLDESAETPPRLRFEIIDTGLGMSNEQLRGLFQPFVQADNSTTRRFGGTGLGLTISKRLVELLGGTITVDSFAGRGSTFTFTIDPGSLDGARRVKTCHEALECNEESAPERTIVSLDGRILLVDDGEDNRRLLSVYLQAAGAKVVTAENGRIGVEKALESHAGGQPFDLILMDMQMPELDGYSATALLRAKGYAAPIVALTANAMSEDRDKCLSAGCTEYLSKPIHRETLLATVARYLKNQTADRPTTSAARPATADTETISSDLTDETLLPLLQKYVEELPARVEQLMSLLWRQDWDELAEMIHNLKGTGGLYGLMPISDAAIRVEERLLGKASLGTIQNAVDELIGIIRRVDGFAESDAASRNSPDHSNPMTNHS